MTIEKLGPPWTEEQVRQLNAYQGEAPMHPFTCPNRAVGHPMSMGDRDRGILIATPAGWVCRHCSYTQMWAWPWMADGQWFKP